MNYYADYSVSVAILDQATLPTIIPSFQAMRRKTGAFKETWNTEGTELFDNDVFWDRIYLQGSVLTVRILGFSKQGLEGQDRLKTLLQEVGAPQRANLQYCAPTPPWDAECMKYIPEEEARIVGISAVRIMAWNKFRLKMGIAISGGMITTWLRNKMFMRYCSVCEWIRELKSECEICHLKLCHDCERWANNATEDEPFWFTYKGSPKPQLRQLRQARVCMEKPGYYCCRDCFSNSDTLDR